MAANNKAVQVRVKSSSASQAGGQRAHDLRLGPQPEYVDQNRSALNRVLVKNATGSELRKICEARRSQREKKRAMKANAAVCFSGIITFGHAAQTYFDELTTEQQDAAYRKVAEAVAKRLETSLHGLVVHLDETSPHAHFQLAGVTVDGRPVSQIAKRSALRDIQTIAAEVMAEFDPRIERGKSRWQRIEEGETYAETVHKDGAEMRAGLAEDIPELRAKIEAAEGELAQAQAKLQTNLDRLAKASEQANAEGAKAEKAQKRAETYERRADTAREDVKNLERILENLRNTQGKLEAVNRSLDETLAQKKTNVQSLRAKKTALAAKLKSLSAV